jgi:hypothetical protein
MTGFPKRSVSIKLPIDRPCHETGRFYLTSPGCVVVLIDGGNNPQPSTRNPKGATMTTRTIAVLISMVIGHLFSPIVRGGEIRIVRPNAKSDTAGKIVEFGKDGGIRTTAPDAPTPPTVTVTKDGTILSTDKDGWTTTIRPGQVQPAESEMEDFCGYMIPKGQSANCVGSYDRAQNEYLDRARQWNLAQLRAQSRNRANNGNGARQRVYIRNFGR